MGSQDLTPELRTRLGKVEWLVGLFVCLAAVMLCTGVAYYAYHTAARKGWFLNKVIYQTCVNDATGIKVGDPVKLMGFDVGEVVRVEANEPSAWYNVTVFFVIRAPYYGYLWSDSVAKINSANLLGNRYIEVIKGTTGVPTVREEQGRIVGVLDQPLVESRLASWKAEAESSGGLTQFYRAVDYFNQLSEKEQSAFYPPMSPDRVYFLEPLESTAFNERLEQLADSLESAIPSLLTMTNPLQAMLQNGNQVSSNLNQISGTLVPAAQQLSLLASRLSGGEGALGAWLLPTNLNQSLEATLVSADGALKQGSNTLGRAESVLATAEGSLQHADAQAAKLAESLSLSLMHLSQITSNLNLQVQQNTNLLTGISSAVQEADTLMQGLQRHWLLRGAFKTEEAASGEDAVDMPQERRFPLKAGPR